MGITVIQGVSDPSGDKPVKPQLGPGDIWNISSPQFLWEQTFGFDPKLSRPKAPKTEEEWLVGFVQNVLYSVISIEYDGLDKPKAMTWPKVALDSSASSQYRPFFSDPWRLNAGDPFRLRAAVRIGYGPKGIKVLPDLDQPRRQPDSAQLPEITLADRPYLKVPDRLGDKRLKRVQYLHAFKLWVVAQSPEEERFALLNSEPYTLITTAEFSLEKRRPLDALINNESRLAKWVSYAVNGLVSRIPQNPPQGRFKRPRTQPGEGSPRPIYTGQTGVERAEKWLIDNGLGPK